MKNKPLSNRALKTKLALIQAGIDLMQDRPIDAIPIDDLVKAAGVAKGSFFNHFENKQSFAKEITINIREELIYLFETAIKDIDDPLLCVAIWMKQVTEFTLTRRAKALILLRAPTDETLFNTVTTRNERMITVIKACTIHDDFRPQAHKFGGLYWHGLCAVLMTTITATNMPREKAYAFLDDMLLLGLTGLGVDLEKADNIIKTIGVTDSGLRPAAMSDAIGLRAS